jgi:hypothetical protein
VSLPMPPAVVVVVGVAEDQWDGQHATSLRCGARKSIVRHTRVLLGLGKPDVMPGLVLLSVQRKPGHLSLGVFSLSRCAALCGRMV